jgi:hypothetical protein
MGEISGMMGGRFGLGFESLDLITVYLYVMFIEAIMSDPELLVKHSLLFL